ncbi:DUF4417 domain-containing protein [Methylomonas rhizoryzae]|uniref:DUF4417 domain-containing protein n=1 Tax=Methylomonas rhizoryzae TaxID=2608981 RepID=UPI001231EBB9|nr:DUF4417 domain-containing protein [Methylomonas rhizoryzae]
MRRNLPYIPTLGYTGDYPTISNKRGDLPQSIKFGRYGSGSTGPFHGFVDDWRLEGIWRDPAYMLDKAGQAGIVIAPDFSVFPHYPHYFACYQVWRSRLVAAWWQANGVTVIPVLQWTHSGDSRLSHYFAGLEHCELVAVRAPSVGFEMDWQAAAECFVSMYPEITVLHFGPRRGSDVFPNCILQSLNPRMSL